jgi:hypothetical protein
MFTNLSRGAFAAASLLGLLTACAPNPNGMGVADFGTVTGRVVDQQSVQPITGATISIGNVVTVTAVPDAGGFVLRSVPVGTQTIRIRAIGWQNYDTTITVTKDQTTDIGVIALPSSLSTK